MAGSSPWTREGSRPRPRLAAFPARAEYRCRRSSVGSGWRREQPGHPAGSQRGRNGWARTPNSPHLCPVSSRSGPAGTALPVQGTQRLPKRILLHSGMRQTGQRERHHPNWTVERLPPFLGLGLLGEQMMPCDPVPLYCVIRTPRHSTCRRRELQVCRWAPHQAACVHAFLTKHREPFS